MISGHYRLTSITQFKWCFLGGANSGLLLHADLDFNVHKIYRPPYLETCLQV